MDTLALRHQLRAAGYCPIPLYGKVPPAYGRNNATKGLVGWQHLQDVTPQQIETWERTWPDARNTGILTRCMPTLDLDILNEDAVRAIEDLTRKHYEERGRILVRIGKVPKRAIPFRTDEPFAKIIANVVASNGRTEKIEFLGDGQQVVAFGTHPETKQRYNWHGGEPGQIARVNLPHICEDEARQLVDAAVDLLVTEFGYRRAAERPQGKKGNGHDGSAGGGAADWQQLLSNIRDGQQLHDSLRDLAAKLVASGMGAGAAVNQLRALMQVSTVAHDGRWQERYDDIPRLVEGAEAFRNERGEAHPAPGNAPLFDPWAQYVVPKFPLDTLPRAVRDYVATQSVVIGCDPSAMAMSILTAFSGALDHRFAVKMLRLGNWWERPRLWTLLIGDPSCKKTPIINAVTGPLEQHQNVLRMNYDAALRDYEAAQEDEENEVEEPIPPPRYVVVDCTIEKLGQILSRSEHGLLVKRDELSGWIGQMEKYSGTHRGAGADRAFWLQAFDGGPYIVDRIGRGETHIGNLSVSLLGGIQPARLAELHGLTSDGLLQRFIPVMMGPSKLAEDQQSDDAAYNRLMRELISAKPRRFIFDDGALSVMNLLRRKLHDLEQASCGLADGFQAFVGKLAGLSGALATILHMAANPKASATRDINAETASHVRDIVLNFILPHAFEFYRTTESTTNGDRLKPLASWILTCNQSMITARNVTRNVACLRGKSLFDVNQHISPLVAAGWLNPVDRTPINKAWRVNPDVAHQFAKRREVEDTRKARVAELMGSPRKNSIKSDAEGRENGGQGVAAERRTQRRHLNGAADHARREDVDSDVAPQGGARESSANRSSIAFMITHAMKAQLRDHGLSDDQIAHLTPQEAHEIITAT